MTYGTSQWPQDMQKNTQATLKSVQIQKPSKIIEFFPRKSAVLSSYVKAG